MTKWEIRFSDEALKQLKKLDKHTITLIDSWIAKHLEHCEDPRSFGKPLIANHKGEWRYRIGDYRMLCEIKDNILLILVIKIGHRRDVYKDN